MNGTTGTIMKTAQASFWTPVRSLRRARLTHASTTARGWRKQSRSSTIFSCACLTDLGARFCVELPSLVALGEIDYRQAGSEKEFASLSGLRQDEERSDDPRH